jgi:hypothetical protein
MEPHLDIDAHLKRHDRFLVMDCVCKREMEALGKDDSRYPLKRCGFLGLPSSVPLGEHVLSREDADQHGYLEGPAAELRRAGLRQPDDEGGQPQPDERAGSVTRAVDAEGQAALLPVDAVGATSASRGSAHSFADAVGEAHTEHPAQALAK